MRIQRNNDGAKNYGATEETTVVKGDFEVGESFGANEFVSDQNSATQRLKCRACLDHPYTRKAGSYAYSTLKFSYYPLNAIYSLLVSLLFAEFNKRHGHTTFQQVGYGTASFIMNAPMAWFFTENAANMFKRLFKFEPLFLASFFMAFVLAVGTTGAGLQVAKESVSGVSWLPSAGVTAFTILSAWNTFSTRFVGSTSLIYGALVWLRNLMHRYRSRYAAYYDLMDDLKRYGDQIKLSAYTDGRSLEESLKGHIQAFYREVSEKSLHPGATWTHRGISTLKSLGTFAVVSLFIMNMQPLWLKLTVEGLSKAGPLKGMGKSVIGVWYAATSNELFYLRSGIKFLPSLISMIMVAGPKIKAAVNNRKSVFKKGLVLAATATAIAGWAAAAYFSGAGFAVDAKDAVNNGFGSIADKTYFSWIGVWTKLFINAGLYDWVVAAGSAGLIVNGGAAVRFMQSKLAFFKEDETEVDKMVALLEEKLAHNDVDDLTRAGVKDTAFQTRDNAKPLPTLWQSIKRSCGYEENPEAEALLENGHSAIA